MIFIPGSRLRERRAQFYFAGANTARNGGGRPFIASSEQGLLLPYLSNDLK